MNILIAAPHSKCPPPEFPRGCDLRSKEIAEKLYKKISENTQKEIKIRISNMYRQDVDLNRIISRDTIWRQDLMDIVENDNISIVLEIHSYPKDSIYGKNGTQLVILNSDDAMKEGRELYYHLRKDNNKIRILIGGNINDIQFQIKTFAKRFNKKIDTYLLEFNEDNIALNNYDLDKIIDGINSFLEKDLRKTKNDKIKNICSIL